MPTWNEHLERISELRDECARHDAAVYALQIRSRKTRTALVKAQKKETVLPSDPSRIATLRMQLAELQKQERAQEAEWEGLAGLESKRLLADRMSGFLEQQLRDVAARIALAEKELASLEREQPLRDDSPETAHANLTRLRTLRDRLQKELHSVRDEIASMLLRQNAAGTRLKELERSIGGIHGESRGLADALASALQPVHAEQGPVESQVAQLDRAVKQAAAAARESKDRLHDAIGGLYAGLHPGHIVRNLPDDVPFLLLPVRIETRFASSGQTSELWVRVYPDDIAIDTHETILTDNEVREGELYWTVRWDARIKGGAAATEAKKSAWTHLAGSFGPQRSAWIIRQTQPENWDVAGAGKPVFPSHDLTKTSSWTRAPHTKILPDKFVVMLYEGNTVVKEVVGKQVPDELIVGPDPQDPDASFIQKDGLLQFGESFDWTSDFDKAVDLGMGFRIPISPQQSVAGFSRVMVMGLYLSADADAGKRALESLIDNHHYSPKGISLVTQGTPTNNTDAGGAGRTADDAGHDSSYDTEAGEPLFNEDDDTDGRRLAEALGIDYGPLLHIANSNARDGSEAVAMNAALYPGSLGYYMGTLLKPVLNEAGQEQLRDFFVHHVTGRGPLPAIRVGKQPYGVLLTSNFGQWEWGPQEPQYSPGFLRGLYATLQKYHAIWEGLLDRLAYVGKPGANDPSSILLNILGLQPGSASFSQRIGYSTDHLRNLDAFKYGGRYYADMQKNFTSKNRLLTFLNSLGYEERDGNGALLVPQLLRLVFQHYHTPLDAANLIDNVPLSESDPIRFYDAAGTKNYLHWLAESTTAAALEKQDFGAGKETPTALLYLMLRRALLLQLHRASVQWLQRNGIDLSATLTAANFANIRPQPDVTKWEVMKTRVGLASPLHPMKSSTVSEYLLTAGRGEEEATFLNQVRDALKQLAMLPTARLERCFVEHLDACTYRLDSWQTGMFALRLRKERQVSTIERRRTRRSGIYVGAYGWVEHLRPSPRHEVAQGAVSPQLLPANGKPLFEYAANGGFVHAPSLNQASAAAVLRSGYLSHATSGTPDLMAVNLSSERIRRALHLLQGIRNGQTLEALLGYQFERGMHDAASADSALINLNLYIYDFRDAYPIERHHIRQQGSEGAVETIPAGDVVNGVKLADAGGDVPYGASGRVTTATPAERDVIRREKDRLADSLDAVKDLLMSEGVYQMVQGNVDRASAVINAMKDANIPPEIDVVNTPRGSAFSFTNRVTLQFDQRNPDDPGSNPWPGIPMTPRATMEPGMNAWVGRLLGVPASIVFRVAHMDEHHAEAGSAVLAVDALSLQPIDLVYITGNELNTGAAEASSENRTSASELEQRIAWQYRKTKGLGDGVEIRIEFLKPEASMTLGKMLPLLRALKGMLTDGRPLHAADFDPPSKQSLADKTNPEGYDVPELMGRIERAQSAQRDLLTAIGALPIDTVTKDTDGNEQHFFSLKDSFGALAATRQTFSDVGFTFGTGDAVLLQSLLLAVAGMGMSDAFPHVQALPDERAKAVLLDQAMSIARRLDQAAAGATARLTDAASASASAVKVHHFIAAGKALLGDMTVILPRFVYSNEADILLSHGDRAQLLQYAVATLQMVYPVDEWVQSVAHVRPRIARWESLVSLHEWLSGERLEHLPVQVPYRAHDSWLAVEFPKEDPDRPGTGFSIEHDTLSITVHGAAAFAPAASHCGLLIDEWTELIPTPSEITGIAFNYDQPNAVPPQALLLAVTPREKGHWTWDDLTGILNDTLLRAKLRAVEPLLLDTVHREEVGTLLPAVLADFSQYDLNIALDYRMNISTVANSSPVVMAADSSND